MDKLPFVQLLYLTTFINKISHYDYLTSKLVILDYLLSSCDLYNISTSILHIIISYQIIKNVEVTNLITYIYLINCKINLFLKIFFLFNPLKLYLKNELELYRALRERIIRGDIFEVYIHNLRLLCYPKQNIITEETLEKLHPKNKRFNCSQTCGICLEEIKENSLYRLLNTCGHIFHCECIDKWFFSGHYACPMCRVKIK